MSYGKTYTVTLGAGASTTLPGGRFFKLIQATAAVDVEFKHANGELVGEFQSMTAGLRFSLEPADVGIESRLVGWGSTKITSATAQTIKCLISRQPVDFDNVQTTVDISKAATLGESVDLSVVDAAAAVVAIAALSGRRTAIIGNKAASTGPVRVGVAPDDTHGIEVQPGMAVYLDVTSDIKVFAPTGGGNQTITRNWIAD